MATDVQIVIDCADPHGLADWWADALGWEVEPTDQGLVRGLLAAGQVTDDDVTTHRGVLVWRSGAALRSPDPGRPRVLFQRVPEGRTGKNRLHLDLRVGHERREAELARLVGRGATELYRASQGPFAWVTLADPEGNEFCLT